VPFSVILDAGYALSAADTAVASGGGSGARGWRNVGEFRQNALEVHAAGRAAPNVSFRLEAALDSSGSDVHTPVAFVRFDDVLPGGALDVRVGRWDAGLPFLSAVRRGTRADYLAPVALDARGIELNGAHAAWTWALGAIESQRLPTDAGAAAHSFNGLEDLEAWAMRDVRGQLFGARGFFDHQESDISFHAFLQRLQVQFAASLGGERWRVMPAYTLDRFDDRPAPGIHQRHQYALLELQALPGAQQRWLLTARFEHGHVTPTVLTPGEDHDREVLRAACYVAPNVRVSLECAHTGDNVGGPHALATDAAVQLVY